MNAVILLSIPTLNSFLPTRCTLLIAITLSLASMARDTCSLAPSRRIRLKNVTMFSKVA